MDSTLQADIARIKLEGFQAISLGIDACFGVAQKEVPTVIGDVKEFVINFLTAKLSGPAATFLQMAMGLVSPAINAGQANITKAISTELTLLDTEVDGFLKSAG